jgi:CheY-like chemotaxis protein
MKLILVVDDDVQVRLVIRKILERPDYVVHEASDGDEASRFLQEASPDLMITDLIMPGKEGLELIQEVRRNHPFAGIIAISGMTKSDPEFNLKMAQALGANCILAKPFTYQMFIGAVENVLASNAVTA